MPIDRRTCRDPPPPENALFDLMFEGAAADDGIQGIFAYRQSRFGVPVAGPDGRTMGTACLVDTNPRRFEEVDSMHLRTIAHALVRGTGGSEQ